MVTVVYPVADLVIPIPNFDGTNNSLMRSIEESQKPDQYDVLGRGPSASPYVPPFSLGAALRLAIRTAAAASRPLADNRRS